MSAFSRVPLSDAVDAHLSLRRASFHTPGHKGRLPALNWPSLDLTELPDTGSLYDGGDAIEQAEQRAAAAFGAGLTLFSAGGCTLCIQTMLALGGGRHVLMVRNAHRSAIQAAALLDTEVTWVWPQGPQITAKEIDNSLSINPDIQSVYITSPNYYGVLADIPAIAAVCQRHGVPLLVDNAHGSHLGAFDRHPLQLGADMTADSAHKTLPVLTGGAYLHIRADGEFPHISPLYAKSTMALFGSTSPSFPVLVSLDRAADWWQTEGPAAFRQLAERLSALQAGPFASFHNIPSSLRDPVRLTLDCGDRDARAAAAHLRECGVEPELADGRYVVCLPTPFNTEDELTRLEQAVAHLASLSLPRCETAAFSPAAMGSPLRAALSPRQALLSPKREVPIRESVGQVCATPVCPCPPGVAALVPGEVVSPEMAEFLESCGIQRIVLANSL